MIFDFFELNEKKMLNLISNCLPLSKGKGFKIRVNDGPNKIVLKKDEQEVKIALKQFNSRTLQFSITVTNGKNSLSELVSLEIDDYDNIKQFSKVIDEQIIEMISKEERTSSINIAKELLKIAKEINDE